MRLNRSSALLAALFLASLLWQAPGVFRLGGVYDEGLILVGADRLLRGEVPYRDFWNTHAPGQISVVAALFGVFGPSILVERAYDVVVRSGVAVVVFVLAAQMGPRAGALVAWAAATLFLGQFSNYGYVTFPALLCALASLLPLLTGARRTITDVGARRRAPALAGAAAGCAILFRHDLGLLAVAAGLAVLWGDVAVRRDDTDPAAASPRRRLGDTFWYLAGVGAVTAPVAGLFLALGTPAHRLRLIFFDYPFLVYPQFRGLPAPAPLLERLAIALPAAAVAAGLVRGLVGARRPAERRETCLPLLALGVLGVLAFPQAYTRLAPPQQIPVIVPALAILPGLLAPSAARGAWRRAPPLLFWAATLALVLRPPLLEYGATVRELLARGTLETAHGLERARRVPLRASQVAAVKALQGLTAEDDAVFVGLGRHDKSRSNDALFSFLADRRSATYYHNLLPGLVTTAAVQREMLAELRRLRPKAVVRYTGRDAAQEPNRSRFPSGVEILDRGIGRDYARTLVIGPYEIWERRKSQAADGDSDYNPAP